MTVLAPPQLPPASEARRAGVQRWAPGLVFGVTLALRLATRAHLPTEWDGVQFALGVDHFDVSQDSPNAPGYWGYVVLARLVRALSPLDAHASLVLVAALASAGTGALMFLAARHLGGDWLGWVAAAVWATNPIPWFYGSIANSKVFDSLALSAMVVLALRARPGGRQAVGAAAVAGLAMGFRPTNAIVVAPLALYVLVRCSRRPADALLPLGVGVLAVLVWLVPLHLEQPGGLARLKAVNDFMFKITAWKTSPFYGAPAEAVRDNAGRSLVTALVGAAAAVPLCLLGIVGRVRNRNARRPMRLGILTAAVLPGLGLNVLVHFGTAGHSLSHLPATLLLLLAPLALHRRPVKKIATVYLVAVSLLGAHRFLAGEGPVPVSLADHRWIPAGQSFVNIRRVDTDLRRHVAIGARLDPSRDVLVFILGNGDARFRPLSLLLDRFAGHLVAGNTDAQTAYRGQLWFDDDEQVEIPPGGRAVVIFIRDDPSLLRTPTGAQAEPVDLGPLVAARTVGAGSYVGVRSSSKRTTPSASRRTTPTAAPAVEAPADPSLGPPPAARRLRNMEKRHTDSGIEIKPVYTAEDLAGVDADEPLGRPGQPPYTRGLYEQMYRSRSGRCASTPASAPPRRPTSASTTCSSRARPACRAPSTCPPRWATTPTTPGPRARSARSAWPSTRSRTWSASSTASRSTRSPRR